MAGLRAQLRLSQAAFARALGVRQQTVSEWERGAYTPRGASVRVLTLLEERSPHEAADGTATRGESSAAGGPAAGPQRPL